MHAAIFPRSEDDEDSSGHDSELADLTSNSGREGGADLAVCVDAPDGGGSNGVMVMAGFWAARRCASRSNSSVGYNERPSKACKFLSDVLERCQTAPEDAHDQHSFNIVLSQYANRRLISFTFLDTSLFLNGTSSSSCAIVILGPYHLQVHRFLLTWSTCADNHQRAAVLALQRFKTTGSQESAANCSDFAGMVFGSWILNRIFRCSLCLVCDFDPWPTNSPFLFPDPGAGSAPSSFGC